MPSVNFSNFFFQVNIIWFQRARLHYRDRWCFGTADDHLCHPSYLAWHEYIKHQLLKKLSSWVKGSFDIYFPLGAWRAGIIVPDKSLTVIQHIIS